MLNIIKQNLKNSVNLDIGIKHLDYGKFSTKKDITLNIGDIKLSFHLELILSVDVLNKLFILEKLIIYRKSMKLTTIDGEYPLNDIEDYEECSKVIKDIIINNMESLMKEYFSFSNFVKVDDYDISYDKRFHFYCLS